MPHDAPPETSGHLIKSFIVVVTCYLLFMMALAVVCGLLFPDAFRALGQDKEVCEDLFTNHAAELFPRGRFLPIVIIMMLLSFAIGCLVIKLAPFSQMSHAVFLVLIVGVTFFQMVFKIVPEIQWLFIVLSAACPICLMIGARWSVPLSGANQDVDSSYPDNDVRTNNQ
jgi:Na+/H+ antiporter NhaD/arsenite permease-like protein